MPKKLKKKAKHSRKATKNEIEKRILTIYQMILKGYSRVEILRYASEKTKWNVSGRQVETYLHRAQERYKKNLDKKEEFLLGKSYTRLENLYRKSFDNSDFKTCLQIEKTIIETFGLEQPKKIDLTSDGEKISGFKVELVDGKKKKEL